MAHITLVDTGTKFSYEKLYVLKKDNKPIAECTVFTHIYDEERQIDYSYIKLCSNVSIAECVETMIEYAKANKFRLIEYPLMWLYGDGSYFSNYLEVEKEEDESDDDNDDEDEYGDGDDYLDCHTRNKMRRNSNPSTAFMISQYVLHNYENTNRLLVSTECRYTKTGIYATYQVLPNIVSYKATKTAVTMHVFDGYSKFQDNQHHITATGDAYIYKHDKTIEVNVYEKPNYDKVVETVNIEFETSLVFVNNADYSADIYTKLTVNNVELACKDASYYRINKWGRYSNIETYTIAYGYSSYDKIKLTRLYVINSLCFPGGDIDNKYIDYTSKVYNDMLDYTNLNKNRMKGMKHSKNVIEKKEFLKRVKSCISQNKTRENDDVVEIMEDDGSVRLGYIYLLREREFLKNDEKVYKVGRTLQKGASLTIDRLKAYKKGSELLFIREVAGDNVKNIETSIVKSFESKFMRHSDGNEYFIGNAEIMIDIINEECCKSRQIYV